jgi:hypothetical protein
MPLRKVLLAALLLAARAAVADPIGPEFQANTYTTANQGFSAIAVASDPTGNFVVVWDSSYNSQDGDGVGIFGQRYDSNGTPVGSEFQVNTYTTDDQGQGALSIATDAAGNFVVVWGGSGQGDYYGIVGRRFDNLGNPVGGEFQVNSYTTGYQGDYRTGVSVASDPGGNFVVVWSGEGPGDIQGVFGRRFDSTGTPQGSDFLVNTYTTGSQGARGGAAVAVDASGKFVVVWDSEGQDGHSTGVFAQRFDATGNLLGPEFQVNTYTTFDQGYRSLAVATDPAGNFLVAWNDNGNEADDFSGVVAQLYDSAGNAVGGEFQVNTYTTGAQGYGGYRDASYGGVAVAADPAGNFVVVWDSDYNALQDGDAFAVVGRRFDNAGNPLTGEFVVNTYTTGGQTNVAVAAGAAGQFVVAWSSRPGDDEPGQDGDYSGVFGQRFGEVDAALILGRRMAVRNPTGGEFRRTVVVSGKERASDIAAIDGDPVANGATLRVIANGTTDSDQTFILDSTGWKATRSGFRYRGPTGADGDPVSRVSFVRTRSGTVVLKATLRGILGTQNLDVVPPNTGDSGGAILTINGGGTYCVAFGDAAGGQESLDTAQTWRIMYATAQPGCPAP